MKLRGLIRPTGQHRAPTPRRAPMFPPAPRCAVASTGFRYCPPCTTDTAAVLHPDGSHTCGDCGHTHHTEEV